VEKVKNVVARLMRYVVLPDVFCEPKMRQINFLPVFRP